METQWDDTLFDFYKCFVEDLKEDTRCALQELTQGQRDLILEKLQEEFRWWL